MIRFREQIEELERYLTDIILDRRHGADAKIWRLILQGLSTLFGMAARGRLAMYEHRLSRARSLGTMVISVGNLTVGGTGKTPVVEMLARHLHQGGRRVAILSRGYKSKQPPFFRRLSDRFRGRKKGKLPRLVSDGKALLLDSRMAGDEPYMLAKNLRGVASVVVDRDRVKSGLYAIRKLGVDTLLLDDGFQYLRLRHRIDIVLVDSTSPFGNGHLLPRGVL
ncbi:MAG: tetraacyldisaccharide 4'-kinase, partial [Verrucomicrobiia bacterium]